MQKKTIIWIWISSSCVNTSLFIFTHPKTKQNLNKNVLQTWISLGTCPKTKLNVCVKTTLLVPSQTTLLAMFFYLWNMQHLH